MVMRGRETYVNVCMYVYVCMHLCTCIGTVYVYVYMYVSVYICIYIYYFYLDKGVRANKLCVFSLLFEYVSNFFFFSCVLLFCFRKFSFLYYVVQRNCLIAIRKPCTICIFGIN